MKKLIYCILCGLLGIGNLVAQTSVTFPGSFANGWEPYIGQTVTLTNTLIVQGYGDYTNEVYLSHERLRLPDEVATDMATDSTDYWNTQRYNQQNAFLLRTNQDLRSIVRFGSTVTNLTARVEAAGILTATNIAWTNTQTESKPDMNDANLLICSANICNYFEKWQNTDKGASSAEEFACQNHKIVAAFLDIDADIYSLVEVEENATALDYLAQQMNANSVSGRYAAANRGITTTASDYQSNGFIYRTDKVRPLGNLYQALQGIYRYKSVFQMFEDLATHERFVLAANHYKAKSSAIPDVETNLVRMDNVRGTYQFLNNALQNNTFGDTDFLLVGDFNAYSMEEPLRYLREQGLVDELLHHSPEGYSYVYKGQVGYIDHALSTPSLHEQITMAAPYHLNADYTKSQYGYEAGNTSKIRYADHDPLLIGMRLQSSGQEEKPCEPIAFTEAFSTSLGAFSVVNLSGDNDWYCDTKNHYARMNGTASDNNEDWLISPAFDLRNTASATLTFQHAANKGNAAKKTEMQTLWVSNDYFGGDPNTATWTQLTIPNYPAGSNWNFVSSGAISLPETCRNDNLHFAFRYKAASRSEASCWEIKDVHLTTTCSTASLPKQDGMPSLPIITALQGMLTIDYATAAAALSASPTLYIYNSMGQCIYADRLHETLTLALPAGLYIVQIDNYTRKTLVP